MQAAALHGFEAGGEAGFDGSEAVVAATDDEASVRELRVRFIEEIEDLSGAHADFAIHVLEGGRDADGREGLVLHLKEALRSLRGACAMLGPLVPEELHVRRDVEVFARTGRTFFMGAEDGIAAIVVLRPETVNDEAALRRLALRGGVGDRTELRTPGHIEQIEVKLAGLTFLLRAERSGESEQSDEGSCDVDRSMHVARITRAANCML